MPQAPRGDDGASGGGFDPPTGEGSGEGLCPSLENFLYFFLKIPYFDAF